MKIYSPVIKQFTRFLALLFLFACVPEKSAPTVPTPIPPMTENQVDSLITVWLKDNVIPLSGVEPQPSNGDLQGFGNAIGNSNYVLLGESVDGSYEIAALKQRLSRFLIDEKDFQLLLMEIPWATSLELNEFLINGSGDLNSVLSNTEVWWLSTTDMRSFFSSLRTYNQTVVPEDQVRVYGVDMLASDNSVNTLTAYLQTVDQNLATLWTLRTACIIPYLNDPIGYFQLSQSTRDACVDSLQTMVDTLSADLERLGSLSSPDEALNALQHAIIVQQITEVYGSSINGSGRLLRQRFMAENIKRLSERFSAKAVVWTDNYAAAFFPVQNKTLSAHLIEQTSDGEVFKAGFTFLGGQIYVNPSDIKGNELLQVMPDAPFASSENYISTANISLGFFRLDGVAAGSARTDWLFSSIGVRESNQFTQSIISREYDAFFYIETCSPARLFVN